MAINNTKAILERECAPWGRELVASTLMVLLLSGIIECFTAASPAATNRHTKKGVWKHPPC